MRIRATVAAVTGALALSALVVPAAQAADAPSGKADFSAAAADGTTSTAATLDVTFSNMKVNKGRNIVVGTSNVVSVPVTYTLTHPVGMDTSENNFASGPLIYRGSSVTSPSNMIISDDPATCTTTSTTTLNCSGTIYLRPADGDLSNADAGTWNAGGLAVDTQTGDHTMQGGLGTTKVQRYSRLTVNAGPEPVYKGKTITSTGKLSRANWEDGHYHGYTNQPVKLQFRKAGTSTYTTVKTVYSNSYGNLKATTAAAYDGYWRFSFAGTTTTPAINAVGDYVDVR